MIKPGKHLKIDDPRIPKRPLSSYILFVKERYNSGDFKGINSVEAARILAQEFKGLSDSEKKVGYMNQFMGKNNADFTTQLYDNLATAERERYTKEMSSTFGTTKPVSA